MGLVDCTQNYSESALDTMMIANGKCKSNRFRDRLSWLVLEILGFSDIQKEERTVQKAIKEAAKRSDMVSAKVDS